MSEKALNTLIQKIDKKSLRYLNTKKFMDLFILDPDGFFGGIIKYVLKKENSFSDYSEVCSIFLRIHKVFLQNHYQVIRMDYISMIKEMDGEDYESRYTDPISGDIKSSKLNFENTDVLIIEDIGVNRSASDDVLAEFASLLKNRIKKRKITIMSIWNKNGGSFSEFSSSSLLNTILEEAPEVCGE